MSKPLTLKSPQFAVFAVVEYNTQKGDYYDNKSRRKESHIYVVEVP